VNKRDLTKGPIHKKLTGLTLPMLIGILSMVAFNLVDTYFVGQLGAKQLAALSFTFPVILVVFSIMQGLGIGATALISRSIGRNDFKKAARETTDSLVLSIIIAGLFIILGIFLVRRIFILLGASDEILPYVIDYMTIWFYALFFVIVPFVGNSAIRATGDAKTPTIIMLFAVIINAILDPLLIFGYGPVPALGIKGAAIATAISRALTMVLSLYVLIFREKLITFVTPSKSVVMGCWKAILYIGLPSGASKMINPIAAGFFTALLAKQSELAVAAFGVGTRLEFLASAILFALSASLGPFTGQNLGATRFDRIRKGLDMSNIFSLGWGLLMAIIFWLLGKSIAQIFTDNETVQEIIVDFLIYVPLSLGFQGIVQNVNAALNTLNSPIQASLLIMVQMVLFGVPLAYFGSVLLQEKGVFLAIAIMYVFGGIISFLYDRKVYKTIKGKYVATA